MLRDAHRSPRVRRRRCGGSAGSRHQVGARLEPPACPMSRQRFACTFNVPSRRTRAREFNPQATSAWPSRAHLTTHRRCRSNLEQGRRRRLHFGAWRGAAAGLFAGIAVTVGALTLQSDPPAGSPHAIRHRPADGTRLLLLIVVQATSRSCPTARPSCTRRGAPSVDCR